MKTLVIYVHGKGGNADEALHYKSLFPDADVLGFDYKAETPWEAKKEFPVYFDSVAAGHDEVTLVANSIGAFFSMNALADKPVKLGAPLTVMDGGEHWFHTDEQMAFLDKWIRTEVLY